MAANVQTKDSTQIYVRQPDGIVYGLRWPEQAGRSDPRRPFRVSQPGANPSALAGFVVPQRPVRGRGECDAELEQRWVLLPLQGAIDPWGTACLHHKGTGPRPEQEGTGSTTRLQSAGRTGGIRRCRGLVRYRVPARRLPFRPRGGCASNPLTQTVFSWNSAEAENNPQRAWGYGILKVTEPSRLASVTVVGVTALASP
jgi:hypothetical protein